MRLLVCLLSATLATINANVSVDKALEHNSDIQYYIGTMQTRYPPQMDEYDAAMNLLIDVTPASTNATSSLRKFRTSSANKVCIPDEGSCSPIDKCCQGGCSTLGQCTCQANNQWCFNYNGIDSFCCSNWCGANGRCKCIPKGESCAVGGEYCCNGLVCDGHSLTCTDQTIPSGSSKPTSQPSKAPVTVKQKSESSGSRNSDCVDGEAKVTIEIKTDRFGGDTEWFIAGQDGYKHANVAKSTYGSYSHDILDVCLEAGDFNFTITDQYGDGLCCAYGDGYVKISIDEREVLHFKNFGRQVSEIIKVGYNPSVYMTRRQKQYLKEHNKRRKYWHQSNNVTYVPLNWSPSLAEESRVYAVKLLDACNTRGILHEPGVDFGENLAKNKGRNGWGQLYPVSKIVGRWVEWEEQLPYPSNGHLTQAMWRSSKYMGCGESAKPHKGGMCRVQVCRYARAGNCDMKRYNSTHGKNWLPPMLSDTSHCGPHCAPEGCF